MATRTPARGRRADSEQRSLAQALATATPVLPYPPRLPKEHEATWLETVNSKTEEYWSVSDVPLLRIYCRCVEEIESLTMDIREEGDVLENARGNPVINPKIMIRAFAENRLMALCTKLRMQPQARSDTADTPAKGKLRNAARKTAQIISDDDDDLLGGAARVPSQMQ